MKRSKRKKKVPSNGTRPRRTFEVILAEYNAKMASVVERLEKALWDE